jgi:hypothetical protein
VPIGDAVEVGVCDRLRVMLTAAVRRGIIVRPLIGHTSVTQPLQKYVSVRLPITQSTVLTPELVREGAIQHSTKISDPGEQ